MATEREKLENINYIHFTYFPLYTIEFLRCEDRRTEYKCLGLMGFGLKRVRAMGWYAGDPCSILGRGGLFYIWIYTPALWVSFGLDIALYKIPHLFILLYIGC
jgi:hypothetical protein